jgi:hypothetical protein
LVQAFDSLDLQFATGLDFQLTGGLPSSFRSALGFGYTFTVFAGEPRWHSSFSGIQWTCFSDWFSNWKLWRSYQKKRK